jgi:hypothetical protein
VDWWTGVITSLRLASASGRRSRTGTAVVLANVWAGTSGAEGGGCG